MMTFLWISNPPAGPHFILILRSSKMDSQLNEIIRDLPPNFEEEMIIDDIIRNLPADIEQRGEKRAAGPAQAVKPKRIRRKEKCPTCGKDVPTDQMARHQRTHGETCFDCPSCDFQGCRRLDYLRQHYRNQHAANGQFKCGKCGWQFASEEVFFEEPHLSTCIKIVSGENPPLEPIMIEEPVAIFFHDPIDPPEAASPFWQDPQIQPYNDDEQVVSLINANWPFFRQHFKTDSQLVQEYYYRTTGTDVANFTIPNALRHVYGLANATFNFNIGTTMLLKRDVGDQPEYRVFVAQNNRQNIFERNILVHNLASLDAAIDKVNQMGDLTEYVDKEGSEWQVVCLLGLVVYVYLRPNFVAGRGKSMLPSFLSCNKKTLVSMERDAHGNIYTDNLCLFRCIVAGKKGDPNDTEAVLNAYETYRQRVDGAHWKQFQGVPEEHMVLIEDLFEVNVAIYRKSSKKTVVCLRKATNPERQTINVHSHPIDASKVHFSLILNVNNFAGKHLCRDCGKMFKKANNLERHKAQSCNDGETKFTYKDACYEAAPTVFDRMAEYGIFVEHSRRKCTSMMVWDMEACLEPLQLKYQRNETEITNEAAEQRLNNQNMEVEYIHDARGLQLRERHRPITGAVKSSVPDFEEKQFFHSPDGDLLINELFAAMTETSDRNYELEKEKFSNEFEQLELLRQKFEAEIGNADEGDDKRREKGTLKKIQSLQRQLNRHCRLLTVIGFNSGRYDLTLVKAHLFPKLVEKARQARQEGADGQDGSRSWPRAITRGSTVLCLMTDELRFLDASLYCPGTNLDKFVKTFNPGGDIKGVFPYELLRQPEDLTRITEFPPKSAFYSTLKNGGISDKEYKDAKAVWDSLPEPRTLLKYIEWYNCRDVEPFLVACQNMHEIFWNDFGIDIFRQAQSIPGVCLAYLFKRLHQVHPTVHFGLFNEQQGDLCQELYRSMTGGLAVIVKRWAEKGVTPIRGNPEIKTENVVGFDFNALYLWAMMQDTPAGYPDHWVLNENSDQFERESETVDEKLKRRKAHGEAHFMQYAAYRDKVYIHQSLHGTQTRLLGKYRVDGFAKDAKPKPRVYEYHGCRYHSHTNGCLNKTLDMTNANKDQPALDEEKMKALNDAGFEVQVTWECVFKEVKGVARKLRIGRPTGTVDQEMLMEARTYNEFLAQHPLRKFNNKQRIAYQGMVEAILNGGIFGFAQIDVSTPDHLKEAYSDFPPIIKHAEVGIEDIGEYMKGIAESLDQLKKPRKSLINSYVGEKMWIMTPLIQLYKEISLEITKIHQVVQFDRVKMFQWFGEAVTEHRKQGDANPDMATLGGIYKLLGNSAYGKTITNLARHMDVFFADAAMVQEVHNDPYHHRTVEITGDCFEIHKRKEKTEFNLPMQIGLSVYAWAKWKVLKFVYQVLQKYVPRDQYDFLESDTDSIYLDLAKKTLKDCVPPEKLAEFEKAEKEWFVLDAAQLRTPGLLKVETEGRAFIGLSAKTYIVLKHDGKGKHSAKGVQYRNAEILTYENYKKILFGEGGDGTAYNIGIRPVKGALYTYVQAKSGLGPLYTKRVCLPDHTTLPLDI